MNTNSYTRYHHTVCLPAADEFRFGNVQYVSALQVRGFITHGAEYVDLGLAALFCLKEPSQLAVAEERIVFEITGTIFIYSYLSVNYSFTTNWRPSK
ncbi:hypothetical protein DPMN_162878 [Dreissena polymorpha]|uniref:Uncharacterized protein n=1 Tax=Dreissena polymorpha TaxID=45954 RepID=A0A9D4IU27_DREPO|nr:hypothetical protein DPMN_162878 [Dreissena polymorpha]